MARTGLQRREPSERLTTKIRKVRGHEVILDADLAAAFGVATRVLNQAVRRHRDRFPSGFMIKLTRHEVNGLRSQIVISNGTRGGRRYLPFAFTEHGAVMLATLLNSPAAVNASIHVVKAFVRLRATSNAVEDLVDRLDVLEASCDKRFKAVFQALRMLLKPERLAAKRQIGFRTSTGSPPGDARGLVWIDVIKTARAKGAGGAA